MGSSIGRAMMLMLLVLLFTTACDASWNKNVRVTNQIPGVTLNVHCKSADDDLGLQELAPNAFFDFSFRSSFIGDTDFYCSFQWPGAPLEWFDIYIGSRDLTVCDKCWWSVRPTQDGPHPCMLNWESGQYEICKPWNK
ncbi:hypothetical protein ACLB2K_041170 [Fragaria x ananassa]